MLSERNRSSPSGSSRDKASEQLEPCYFTGHWQLELRGLSRLDGHLFLRVVVLVLIRFFLSCLIERIAARMPVDWMSFLLGGATEYASSSLRERFHIFFNGNIQDDAIFAVCHAKRHVPVLGHRQNRRLGNAQWSGISVGVAS